MVQKGDGGRELCIWCLFNAISQEVCLFSFLQTFEEDQVVVNKFSLTG